MKRNKRPDLEKYLGKIVKMTVDRPLGSSHPNDPGMIYPINYGYLSGVRGGDGKEQDVYLLGVDKPVDTYTAKIIAIIYRKDDKEDKLVAAPEGMLFTEKQIRQAVYFQEQYFHTKLKLDITQRPMVRFYRDDPDAPRTTMPAHLGANAIITWDGKLLLEKRRDSETWGLVGGGVKKTETTAEAIAREIYEELGLSVTPQQVRKLTVYGEPGRIAAYRDGSIWRMVVVLFALELDQEPNLRISAESKDLRFFTKEELQDIQIVITHSDMVEDWFLNC